MDCRFVKTYKLTERKKKISETMQDFSLTTHLDYVAIWKERMEGKRIVTK